MAIETKQLPKEIVDNLISYKNNYTNAVYNLGEHHMKLSSMKKELKKAEDDTTLYENEVDKTYDILNTSLSELEKQYPKGEVNLLDGTVTFDNNQ
jgi:hypothetical protein